MRNVAAWLLLPWLWLGAGCTYSVDDGQWTYQWRAEGHELRDSALLWNASCRARADGTELLAHVRTSRLRACAHACSTATTAEKDACILRCDASIAFVSAQCEPRTHEQTWSPALTR